MEKIKVKYDYQSTLKSMDTEEYIDLKFYRPLGYMWAIFFEKLGVTPNVITVLSIILGIGAGVMFYFDNIYYTIAGMILLIWANTYDSADGQLARMTGQYSRLGRILDGASGDIWFITIYAAICFRLMPQWGIYIWLLAAFAGYWHSKQAAVADYLRNFHLFFLKGKKGSELDDSHKVEEEYKQLKFSKEPLYTFFMLFYVGYTRNQEKLTPKMQQLRATLREKYGDDSIPASFSEKFRQASLPYMKYTNILSFNTRVIALFISLIIGEPWLYFVFEIIILNAVLFYLLLNYERICSAFNRELRGE